MPRRWRSQKKPPQVRESEKEKKTLEDHCREISTTLAEARRAKVAAEKREKDRLIEDEQMALMYGPDWRTRTDLDDRPKEETQLKAS